MAAAIALWLAVGFVVLPRCRPVRLAPVPVAWFAVYTTLLWIACLGAPLYGFLAWSGFVLALRAFPGTWILAGVGLTALPLALSQIGGDLGGGAGQIVLYVGLVLVNTTVAGFFLWAGALEEERREEREQTLAQLREANERLELTLAENAALQHQLVLGAREAGVADERARLAGEIHDTIAQGLSGIITQLEAARTAGPDEAGAHHDAAIGLARGSLAEARRSIQALRPQPLEDGRLTEALEKLAGEWSERHGVAAAVRRTGEVRSMHPDVEVALLRTGQEALANVARHADAERVVLTLSYMDASVSLDVRDDGVGFDPVSRRAPEANGNAGGFGLVAMRDRVESLDGTLSVESSTGTGTAVSASLPTRSSA
ncbi:sensor histidine kinase [Thermoleophilia bacterium SCSIO 60948]|nr:sensor histidine kinase [Thermoleophilia bacterium SCSIO 60948]